MCQDGGGSVTNPATAVADLQKINQELQKLQLNDDDDEDDMASVFSGSSLLNGSAGNGLIPENGYFDADLAVRQRRSSFTRDGWAESPAVSLRSFAPSPSPRINEVKIKCVGDGLESRPMSVHRISYRTEAFRLNFSLGWFGDIGARVGNVPKSDYAQTSASS